VERTRDLLVPKTFGPDSSASSRELGRGALAAPAFECEMLQVGHLYTLAHFLATRGLLKGRPLFVPGPSRRVLVGFIRPPCRGNVPAGSGTVSRALPPRGRMLSSGSGYRCLACRPGISSIWRSRHTTLVSAFATDPSRSPPSPPPPAPPQRGFALYAPVDSPRCRGPFGSPSAGRSWSGGR